jgi:hypothetical protein
MSRGCSRKLKRLRHHRTRSGLPTLTRARRTPGIVAATAVFASSLTSIVNCVSLCAAAASGASNCASAVTEAPLCHGDPSSVPVSVPASRGRGSRPDCPSRNCPGQHSVSTLQALLTPPVTLSATRGAGFDARLGPWSPSTAFHLLPQILARCGFSHSPPRTSGRSICTQESLFRI